MALGPAGDGGFYLVAATDAASLAAAFAGVTWSRSSVLDEVDGAARRVGPRRGVRVTPWTDVDDRADLAALVRRARAGAEDAPSRPRHPSTMAQVDAAGRLARRRVRRVACTAALAMVMLGAASCGSPSGGETTVSAGQAPLEPPALKIIQHEEPRRDFVGPQPARFRWSPIDGADRYAIGLWNEADRLLWRHDDLTEPTVDWPQELVVDDGTYFWSVSALPNGREIAKSGTAAFVIE